MDRPSLRQAVERLRRPEYTGENRCWPCTAVNVGVVLVLGVAARRRSRLLGVLTLAFGSVLVALRGYIVPGTPRVAPRLVDPFPFEFGHGTPAGAGSGSLAGDVDPETLMESLADAGVIGVDGETLHLDEAFRDAWEDRMATLRGLSGPALAERAAAASGENVEGECYGEQVVLASDREVWLSPAVAIAETAAVETLAQWDVPGELRAPAAKPLRTFLRICPACGGDVTETTLRDCCGGPGGTRRLPERPVLACEDCETVVYEFDETTV